jgi:hypothetical protein
MCCHLLPFWRSCRIFWTRGSPGTQKTLVETIAAKYALRRTSLVDALQERQHVPPLAAFLCGAAKPGQVCTALQVFRIVMLVILSQLAT